MQLQFPASNQQPANLQISISFDFSPRAVIDICISQCAFRLTASLTDKGTVVPKCLRFLRKYQCPKKLQLEHNPPICLCQKSSCYIVNNWQFTASTRRHGNPILPTAVYENTYPTFVKTVSFNSERPGVLLRTHRIWQWLFILDNHCLIRWITINRIFIIRIFAIQICNDSTNWCLHAHYDGWITQSRWSLIHIWKLKKHLSESPSKFCNRIRFLF